MAHTARPKGDKRRFADTHTVGTEIAIRTSHGWAAGIINRDDEGGWIYPLWNYRPRDYKGHLPGWCRIGNVIVMTPEIEKTIQAQKAQETASAA